MYYFACPACGSRDKFYRLTDPGSPGCALFIFGGIIPYWIYASSKADSQCAACGCLFRKPPIPRGGTTKAINFLFFIAALSIVIGIITEFYYAANLSYPEDQLLIAFEQFVTNHPIGTSITFATFLILFTLSGLIISVVSQRRFVQEFKSLLSKIIFSFS